MPIVKMNPVGVIGHFIGQYEDFIKPEMLEGIIDGSRGILIGLKARRDLALQEIPILSWPEGTLVRYGLAVTHLPEREDKASFIKGQIPYIDRQVNELDIILRDNEDYQRFKKLYSNPN